VLLGSNPFAAYSEWCGNHPTPDFADITGTVDPSDLPAGAVVGPLACTGTEKVTGINSSGALVCGADVDTDTDTTYSAGTGLTLSGTTFSANTSVLQSRVSGSCTAGNSIRQINADGTVICEPDTDTDTNTTYSAGSGLDLSGTTFLVDPTDFFGTNPATDSWASGVTTSTGAPVLLRSTSLDVPGSGRIVVIGNTGVYCSDCTDGDYAGAFIHVTATNSGSCNTGAYKYFRTGNWGSMAVDSLTVFDVFTVSSSGTYTYYLRGEHQNGVADVDFYYPSIVAFFLPN
jgi:hypothetical protein